MHNSLASTILALSALASAHQHHGHGHGHARNEGAIPLVSRSLSRRWESSPFNSLINRSNGPQPNPKADVEPTETTLGGTPMNAIPRHYNMTIEPDFKTLSFKGGIIIDLDIAEDSYSIFLNTRNITLTDWMVALTFENGTELQLSGPSEVGVNETESGMTFAFPALGNERLTAGSTVSMSIGYEGVIFGAEEAFGLFQNLYTKEDGSSGMYLLTQLEMDGARRIYPCLDDPSLKANFTVSLISAESHTLLSNMDVDTESRVGDKKKITFNTSPPMSTYLLALAVGELDFIESTDFHVPIRVYASPSRNLDWAKYALAVAVEGMKKLEEVLGVEYALPKIDHVAIEGGSFGGMENWGLITIAQDMLILDGTDSTLEARQVTAELVLHELAHMWFGDLVTMDWWTQIWLNEGFANYFTYWALKASYPKLDMVSQMPQWLRQLGMQADSFNNAHALAFPTNRTDISKATYFDTISYYKGASILRMIDAYISEETLMEGLHRYLTTHKYDNTVTLDLWEALGQGAREMWGPWTENPGHPVVYVTETEDSITVEQHRFSWGGNITEADDSVIFPIPLLLRKADGVDTAVVLKEQQSTIELRDDTDFFFLNSDSAGFYRVAYTPKRLRKLAAQADKLTPADRLGLVHDTMAVASTGHLSVVDSLDLLARLMETDEDYWVWTTMLESGVASAAAIWMYDEEIYAAFENFTRTQTSRLVERLGWPSAYWKLESKDDDLLTRFQALVFEHAGLAGDEAVVEAAREMIAKFPVEGKKALDPNIREAAIWVAVKYGGEEEYHAVVEAYMAEENPGVQGVLLRSLGRTANPKLLEHTLELILDETVLPPLKPFIMEGVVSSGPGIRVALQWVQDRWSDIANVVGVTPAEILAKLVAKMSSREDIEVLAKWMMEPARAQYFETLQPAVTLALLTAGWAERDLEGVKEWLATVT